ncbi:outer membrane protein [Bartonella krasnovii]|uniref:outer membrane protein n=1 Tax=Bartonella krasnovii TaxID=2267275 RepID=UPI001F4CCF94|nr:outer membrane protein [Bartonella krasnovii]UNF35693.1 porin family protein [Bartonella krasnovii]UNF39006.1 porin family protein [Bartonella krasnovii]UNF40738.1 porin family protein [Bartonella krasnovii]UNF45658.1 porin family protein [Bartonella krasnovii]UNF47245.1 porin family protein [Bartonella krasnovii]
MNMKWLITASAFAFVSVSAAQAADVIVPPNPTPVAPVIVAPTFSWTGFYVGGQIGGFSGKTKMDILAKGQRIPVNNDYLPKLSGFMGGLYGGSNIDLGNGLILGVDTDIMWSNKDDKKTGETFVITPDQFSYIKKILKDASINIDEEALKKGAKRTHSFTFKEKWAGATRVRIGFAAERIMPYVAGGIAYTQLQDNISISITGKDSDKDSEKVIASGALSDETKTLVGYTLGAGVDLAMTNNIIVRAEYRYSDFGKKKFSNDKYETSYKTNDFRVGVAYKF